MEVAILLLMIAVACYNVYSILQVGVDQASTMQWVVAAAMIVFVIMRIMRMLSARR